MDDKKRIGLIVTIGTVLLCGCPGLCILASGALFSFGYDLENYGFDVNGNPQAVAIPMICVGVIMLLIPLAAGIYTVMQNRKMREVEDIDVPDPLEG